MIIYNCSVLVIFWCNLGGFIKLLDQIVNMRDAIGKSWYNGYDLKCDT